MKTGEITQDVTRVTHKEQRPQWLRHSERDFDSAVPPALCYRALRGLSDPNARSILGRNLVLLKLSVRHFVSPNPQNFL